jgi:hypothetical protein
MNTPKENESLEASPIPSPRELYKSFHPDLFSDSVKNTEPQLNSISLENHLSTLGNRRQETDFENFAKALIQKTICPNLLPQTGSTGGGDGKVDSETFPVASQLSLAWWTGVNSEADSERWAFAFSTQKTWKPKLGADINKIHETGRGYKKAIFVTSEYVRAAEQKDLEDKLSKKYGLEVRILDRNFIIEKALSTEKLREITVKELKMDIPSTEYFKKGPLDYKREQELEELNEQIEDTLQKGVVNNTVVEDSLKAALLASRLERPKYEVDGFFARAQQIAEKYGSTHKVLLAYYQHAWISFWWQEDFMQFNQHYVKLEALAKGTMNVYELELLNNLNSVFETAVYQEKVVHDVDDLKARFTFLANELNRIAQDESMSSASLHAKTILAVRGLMHNPEDATKYLKHLQEFIKQSEGLAGYPFGTFAELIMGMGNVFSTLPAYQELLDQLTAAVTKRDGDLAGAKISIERAAQFMSAGKPYEVIRTAGRALPKLYKEETMEEMVRALFLCAVAYEEIGLFWAARGTMLAAASLALSEFWNHHRVFSYQSLCCNFIKWIELRLGRVPQILAWHEVDSLIKQALLHEGYPETILSGEDNFDAIVGMHFLNADIDQLKKLTKVPDTLDHLGLERSGMALRFALGNKEELEIIKTSLGDEDLVEFIAKWRNQPASEDIVQRPTFYEGDTVTLEATVLGCQISIEAENSPACIALSESILAALEAFLATGFNDGVIAKTPLVKVTVQRGEVDLIESEIIETASSVSVSIACENFELRKIPRARQGEIQDKVFGAVANISATGFIFSDTEKTLEKLFGEDRVCDRALGFTSSFITVGNVFGDEQKLSMNDWYSDKEVILERTEKWDAELPKNAGKPKEVLSDKKEVDRTQMKHTDIKLISLISASDWDRAGWVGVGYLTAPSRPPVMILLFSSVAAANAIFQEWRKQIGDDDTDDRLAITILKGIDTRHPNYYRVSIGAMPQEKDGLVVTMTRNHLMTPTSTSNLDRFLTSYKAYKGFLLTFAVCADPAALNLSEVHFNEGIVKRHIHAKEAWEVADGDIEALGIFPDDRPHIPSVHITDAPVLELLKKRKKRGAK